MVKKTAPAGPERLEWCGPTGHTSPMFGDLVPGQRYEVPADCVKAFLRQPDFWKQPGAVAPEVEADQ